MRQRPLFSLSIAAAAIVSLPTGRLTAQAVERTDTPRRGALRVTFDPRITTWEEVFTPGGRQPLGAAFAGDRPRPGERARRHRTGGLRRAARGQPARDPFRTARHAHRTRVRPHESAVARRDDPDRARRGPRAVP